MKFKLGELVEWNKMMGKHPHQEELGEVMEQIENGKKARIKWPDGTESIEMVKFLK